MILDTHPFDSQMTTTTNDPKAPVPAPAKAADEAVDKVAPPQLQNDCPSSTQVNEKRARKRQLDRISQRRKRQKDRDTMERLKRSLAQPNDPTLLHSLVLKQEQDLARIHRHGERMMQIQALIQADLADLEQEQPHGQHRNSQTPSSDDSSSVYHTGMKAVPLKPCPDTNDPVISSLQPQLGSDTNTAILPLDPHIDLNGLSWDAMEVPQLDKRMQPSGVAGAFENDYSDVLSVIANETPNVDHGIFGSSKQHISPPNSMQFQTKLIGQPLNPTEPPMTEERLCVGCESTWRAANVYIGLARNHYGNSPDSQLLGEPETATDAHLIITAIAEGWDAAEQSPFWNEQWRLLRQIDQICHGDSGTVERLVTLFNVRRMIKVREQYTP